MGAVIIDHGVDRGLVWHYGDPLREQRWLDDGTGVVDLANRQVVRITGRDRRVLIGDRGRGGSATGSAYWLGSRGQIIGRLAWVECENTAWGWVEGRRLAQSPCRITLQGGVIRDSDGIVSPTGADSTTQPLQNCSDGHSAPGFDGVRHCKGKRDFLELDIAVEAHPDMTVRWSGHPGPVSRSGTTDCLGGYELFLPRETPLAGRPVGIWAHTARRIAAGVPRVGVDTDDHTLMAELSPLGSPRRLVRLHLDGSAERFLDPATPLVLPGGTPTTVGFLGSMSYHRELGPIALGLVNSAIDVSTTLLADGVPATVEELRPA